MKNVLLGTFLLFLWAACQAPAPKQETSSSVPSLELPYQATYTADWEDDASHYVSDEDLKMVLQGYKHWESGNIDAMLAAFNDTMEVTYSAGPMRVEPKANLKNLWQKGRDSLSQVSIQMQSWHKMYSPATQDAYIAVWYKEYDTYKDGRKDSAEFHDLNLIKNSKISWISTYRRPL